MTSTGPRPGHPTEAELADAIERHGGRLDESQGQPRWWITDPSSAAEDTAAHIGLAEHRRLFQMRRPLPLDLTPVDDAEPPPTLDTRAFDPSRDVDTWLAINNAAFSWHPEQGGWTRETLEARMAEPWFDLDDFRIADLDGTMAGFCWTKVHPETATEPRLGEIYVIAVAPARVGTGLGTALTVAGLDWLWARRHTPVGMLYVESDNDRALATYRRLGFRIHSTDVAFEPPPSAAVGPSAP